ncbi:globin domain-containing protein [Aliarcobacter cibarius]|uniref:globin domain-containing protein n=1 Tax=Aliarcobacter cibarius TaxID=255507 RepID=UPI0010FD34FC|nr:globin [Aliarcobacter cibarius]TLT02900.1 globin [Aliarcobacter cibarius]
MQFNISQAQFGVRPSVTLPNPEFLKVVGEDGLRKIISDHYDLIRKSPINNIFPEDEKEFEQAKINSSDFFIQICGGPKYFNENRGAPMMVARHQPFKITPKTRMVWLECYIEVLKKIDIDEELLKSFWNYLDIFSIWMVNTPED